MKKGRLVVTEIHRVSTETKMELPLFYPNVSAGFPSPADDYFEERLDLNRELIKHPAATFFVRVEGDSMIDAGIHSGDILIVDRSLRPRKDAVVIAVLDGELTVKRLRQVDGELYLIPDNPDFDPIKVSEENDLSIWGIVTYSIHHLCVNRK